MPPKQRVIDNKLEKYQTIYNLLKFNEHYEQLVDELKEELVEKERKVEKELSKNNEEILTEYYLDDIFEEYFNDYYNLKIFGEAYRILYEEQKDQDDRNRLVWVFPLRLLRDDQKELQKEFEEIQQVENFPVQETEKERLIKSRVGQGKFKKLLIDRECKCALCGVTDPRMLIASHIKPWRDATNEERLDMNNGLLLCPNHDVLFDKNFISFDSDGKIVISQAVENTDRIFLNINDRLRINLNEKQLKYMKGHYAKLV